MPQPLPNILPTPLADAHKSAGANIGTWFGCALPDDFGDWRKEYVYLRESVALLDKNYRAYLNFTGPDRVRYLNAILTNNIKDLQPGHGVASLFLNPQGHIQAEIETYATPESLFCVSFASVRDALIAGLDKYIIMDDVTLTDVTSNYATLALEGQRAAALLAQLAQLEINALADLEFRDTAINDVPCRIIRRSPGGVPSADFLCAHSHAQQLWNSLSNAASAFAGGPAGYTALSALRLEQGIPWFSYDFGDKQIPHEAGLHDSHISYTKGCYTGQEIVERVRSRGHVNRVRILLQFAQTTAPAPQSPLLADGKEVGLITRTAFSPILNSLIGMAYVRREKSTPGTVLQTHSGDATVIEPPLKSAT